MVSDRDSYAGDLEGVPCVAAASMRVGVCRDGQSVGVDLLDAHGTTIAHGHLELVAAIDFINRWSDACEALLRAMGGGAALDRRRHDG